MTGSERERGVDLDADAVCRHTGTIVRAVNEETTGGDRPQSGEAGADPILRDDGLEGDRLGRGRAGGGRDQRAERIFVGRPTEVYRHAPASAAGIR